MSMRRVGGLGNSISVTIPRDEEGYLGRECPNQECLGYFKVTPGTGIADVTTCTCPYCGTSEKHDHFWTPEQIAYAQSMARRTVVDAFQQDLKSMEFRHRPRGRFGIGISLTVKSSPLPPIDQYSEKDLETEVVCERCTLRYAIYGVFGYCPDCGTHNSLGILEANLQVVGKMLALAESQSDNALREKLLGSALLDCVAAFEGWGSATAQAFSHLATDPAKATKLAFQNIRKAQERVLALFNYDLGSALSEEEFRAVHLVFQKRHVLSHNMGVVDKPYVDSTGDASTPIGQKVKFSGAEISLVATLLPKIARKFVEHLEARP